MIHCRNCRTLLNPELERDSVEVPVFIPLQELGVMIEIVPTGLFASCPKCAQELKINRKYLGQRVQCKFCNVDFRLDVIAFGDLTDKRFADLGKAATAVSLPKETIDTLIAGGREAIARNPEVLALTR